MTQCHESRVRNLLLKHFETFVIHSRESDVTKTENIEIIKSETW